MSNPAQGAVGAETKTAGPKMVLLPMDDPRRPLNDSGLPSAMIWAGGEAYDELTMPGVAAKTLDLDSCSLAVGIYRAMTEAHAKEIAALSPATPRTDSDEGAAGEAGDLAAAIDVIDRCLKLAHDNSLDTMHVSGSPRHWKAVLEKLKDATPAPATPPGVPDSVRALSEAASKGPWRLEPATPGFRAPAENEAADMMIVAADSLVPGVLWDASYIDAQKANIEFTVAAVNFVRTLLATHPAGQSTGSGEGGLIGDDLRSGEPQDDPDAGLTHWQIAEEIQELASDGRGIKATIYAAIERAYMRGLQHARRSAPDSPLTGPVGVERPDGAIHNGREHLRRLGLYGFTANDGHVLDCCEDYIGAQQCFEVMAEALAARPAAPEAQGAERVRHVKRGTEYEVLHRGVELQVAVARGEPVELLETTLEPQPACWEGDRLVIYQGTDGKLWAREESEFDDGRFESAPPSSGQGGR